MDFSRSKGCVPRDTTIPNGITYQCNRLRTAALVNHSLGDDVTAGYVQMTVERLREPAQRVVDRLKELCAIVGAPPAASGAPPLPDVAE